MTFFSSIPSILSSKKANAIFLLSVIALFSSNSALASCKTSDVAFYLEKGFTNEQIVQLCGATQANQANRPQPAQNSQAQFQQAQQASQIQQDQAYFSDAFDAKSVTITNNSITILPEECVSPKVFGEENELKGKTICVDTKITINRTGMVIGKASKGYLIGKPLLNVRGNIQRELTGIDRITFRPHKQIAIEKLPLTMNQINLEARRGASIKSVASRLAKYSK